MGIKTKISGVWLPVITPFFEGKIDYRSYERLIINYFSKGLSGIIVSGTTGESPVISETELEELVDKTLDIVNGVFPVYVGIGGNFTDQVVKKIKRFQKYRIHGILSVCPYYNRPSQKGLLQHFLKISESTDLDIIIYNIPYRTGVNLENDTLFKLADQQNIIAVKDACGNFRQSAELLAHRPDNLCVLTGEDILFYTTLVNGGQGGILASAHFEPAVFHRIFDLVRMNSHKYALEEWRNLEPVIPLFFKEPNPGPLKYYLYKKGLLRSPELRLPLTEISESLKRRIDQAVEEYEKDE